MALRRPLSTTSYTSLLRHVSGVGNDLLETEKRVDFIARNWTSVLVDSRRVDLWEELKQLVTSIKVARTVVTTIETRVKEKRSLIGDEEVDDDDVEIKIEQLDESNPPMIMQITPARSRKRPSGGANDEGDYPSSLRKKRACHQYLVDCQSDRPNSGLSMNSDVEISSSFDEDVNLHDVQSSEEDFESSKSKTKKTIAQRKNTEWNFHEKIPPDSSDILQVLRTEWSVNYTNSTAEGVKSVVHYCKVHGQFCKALLKLVYQLDGSVHMYRNQEYEHSENPLKSQHGLSNEQKQIIESSIHEEISKPKELLKVFRDKGMEEPKKVQVVNYLAYLKKRKDRSERRLQGHTVGITDFDPKLGIDLGISVKRKRGRPKGSTRNNGVSKPVPSVLPSSVNSINNTNTSFGEVTKFSNHNPVA